jgi:hypothetical protein
MIGVTDRAAAKDQLVIVGTVQLAHPRIDGMALSGYPTDYHAIELFVASDVGKS